MKFDALFAQLVLAFTVSIISGAQSMFTDLFFIAIVAAFVLATWGLVVVFDRLTGAHR